MLTEQRKSLLLDRLRADGRLVAKDLSLELAVSEDTIRRDLRELAADGLLKRVHGGALPLAPEHGPLVRRVGLKTDEKAQLARLAAPLVTSGSVCFVDGGSTHAALLNALPAELDATIITHSPTIAAATERLPRVTCILIGGTIYKQSMVALGAKAHGALGDLAFDVAFIGGTAFAPDRGLMTVDREEALFKAAAAERAASVAVMLTAEKIGASAPFKIMDAAAITTMIVPDVPLPDTLTASTDVLLS